MLAERHERGSLIITSNLGFGDWTQVFGDANLTATLLDRLTHKAHIIECSWQSYRLQEALQGQASN
ncbi:ATP-binding protein [Desulfohalobium retbaense]|uniref:ATP-binding protein n=1 Tax=Desulfohalobium retbaense TaxID=45663 RepID=UPI00019B4AAD|nr:ATP-binding protein [Desulfohalobium retbaense]